MAASSRDAARARLRLLTFRGWWPHDDKVDVGHPVDHRHTAQPINILEGLQINRPLNYSLFEVTRLLRNWQEPMTCHLFHFALT